MPPARDCFASAGFSGYNACTYMTFNGPTNFPCGTGGAAVNKNLPPLIAEMLRPEFYPNKPAEVELRQTHISYVFIAGDRVYKIKKNVKFPFLDYSTLDKRRHFCAEEVRLNRRLAPNTYLGTVGISRLGRGAFLSIETRVTRSVLSKNTRSR